MPGFATFVATWVLERMVLQALGWDADARAPRQQSLTVRGDEVGHRAAHPDVAVQPEAAVHRVNHAVATLRKLHPLGEQRGRIARRRDGRNPERLRVRQRQATTPSGSPGNGGEATKPEYTVHVSGYDCGCVARADHPPVVAEMIVNTTPCDVV